jgi:hypothetical protein
MLRVLIDLSAFALGPLFPVELVVWLPTAIT